MLIGFTIIMILIGTALSLSIYTLYAPFIKQLADIKWYNIAYYGAYWSMERAVLTLRYRWPWFEWSGWWRWTTSFGPKSDAKTEDFSFLTINNNGTNRSIRSKTLRIPQPSDTDVNRLFAQESKGRNSLATNTRIQIPLSLDNETDPDNFYRVPLTNFTRFWWNNLNVSLRLNPTLYARYPNPTLRTSESLYGVYPDDELIARTMDWFTNSTYFRIFKHDGMIYYGDNPSKSPNDMAIRESLLNARYPVGANSGASLIFGSNFQPLIDTLSTDVWQQNVSSAESSTLSGKTFSDLFADTSIKDLNLSLAGIALPVSAWWDIYPFVEYMIDWGWENLADVYYTIETHGYVGEYNVTMIYKKPVNDTNIAWDFTVFF